MTNNHITSSSSNNIAADKVSSVFSQSDINSNDVLCGRGAFVNKHTGNIHFRELVSSQKEHYTEAKSMEKNQIAARIVDAVHNLDPPGRFLKRMSADESMWKVVSDKVARGKTSQALREKGNQQQQQQQQQLENTCSSFQQGTRKRRRSIEGSDFLSNKQQPQPHYPRPINNNFFMNEADLGAQQQHVIPPHLTAWRVQSNVIPATSFPPPLFPLNFHNNNNNNKSPAMLKPERTTSGGETMKQQPQPPSSPLHVLSHAAIALKDSKEKEMTIANTNTNTNTNVVSPPSSPVQTDDDGGDDDHKTVLVDPKGMIVTEINDNDVLLGRGAGVNRHTGNRRFRDLVQSQRVGYVAAVKLGKKKIAQDIVQMVRESSPRGRFLTKHPEQENAWVDVGNERAREKTSQALREGAPALHKEQQLQQQQQQELEQLQAKKNNHNNTNVALAPLLLPGKSGFRHPLQVEQGMNLFNNGPNSLPYNCNYNVNQQTQYSRRMLEWMILGKQFPPPVMPPSYTADLEAQNSFVKRRRIGAAANF